MKTDKESKISKLARKGLPRQPSAIVLAAIFVSLLIHGFSAFKLPSGAQRGLDSSKRQQKVKIRFVEKKKATPQDTEGKKILEAQQKKTEPPKEADHLGQVDHQAKKETRLPNKLRRKKAQDPGQTGVTAQPKRQPPKRNDQKTANGKQKTKPTNQQAITKNKNGTVSFGSSKRENYESLLPSYADLNHQMAQGYQDYVDERVEEGDRIDINTKQYRYIGYMTGLRKAIELVWNYPIEASRRGLQGEVGLEFHIQKNGQTSRIKVVKSSGYDVLDDAIVEAVKLASPFAPLPPGEKSKRKIISGTFRYVLNTYGSH